MMNAQTKSLPQYPGVGLAFSDMVMALRRSLKEENAYAINEVVLRETHAAKADEVTELFDAACETIIAETPSFEQQWILKRLEAIRAEAERFVGSVFTPIDVLTDDIVSGMLSVVHCTDVDLYDHLIAVGVFSGRIAHEMGLSEEMISDCVITGRLHDLGKLALPGKIVNAPRKLSDEEMAIVRRHADLGYKMLLGIPRLAKYAALVRAHHERVDGSGYPDNLAGEAIPLVSRIVAVADVFHAMTADRPYRRGLAPEVAAEHIRTNSGTLYDSSVVAAAGVLLGSRRLVAA